MIIYPLKLLILKLIILIPFLHLTNIKPYRSIIFIVNRWKILSKNKKKKNNFNCNNKTRDKVKFKIFYRSSQKLKRVKNQIKLTINNMKCFKFKDWIKIHMMKFTRILCSKLIMRIQNY